MDWMELISVVLVAVFVLCIVLLFVVLYFLFACLQEQMDDEEDFLRGFMMWAIPLLLFCSCASQRESAPSVTIRDSLRIERLVAHPIEPKESSLEAWMECDERGRVLLSKIEELEDDKLSLSLSLDSLGRLLVKARTAPDTIWAKADSVVVYRKEEVPVPVERALGWWEMARMRLGDISVVALVLGIAYVVRWLVKCGLRK